LHKASPPPPGCSAGMDPGLYDDVYEGPGTDRSSQPSDDVRIPYPERTAAETHLFERRAGVPRPASSIRRSWNDSCEDGRGGGRNDRSESMRRPSVGDPKGPGPPGSRPREEATRSALVFAIPRFPNRSVPKHHAFADRMRCTANHDLFLFAIPSPSFSRLAFGLGGGTSPSAGRTRNEPLPPIFAPRSPACTPSRRCAPPLLPAFPRHRRPSFSHRRTSNPGSIPSSSRHIVLPPAPPASAPTHLSTSPLGRSFLRLDRSRAEAQAARTREATSNVTRVASSPLSLCPSPEGKGRTWTKGRHRYLDRKISMGGRGMGIEVGKGEGRRETDVYPPEGKEETGRRPGAPLGPWCEEDRR